MVERVEVRAAISSKPPRRVPVAWWCAAVFVLAISAYSLRYVVLGDRAYEPDLAPSFRARPLTVMAHTLFGPIALTLGLVNLLPAMRQRRRWLVHRWLGRIYLIASIVLGLAGLSLSLHAFGGPGPRTAFGLLGRSSSLHTRDSSCQPIDGPRMIRRGWRPQFARPEGFAVT